jgi:hypothetical protein
LINRKKLTIFALVAVLLMAFSGSAFAAAGSYVWKSAGGVDDNWNNSNNWEPLLPGGTIDANSVPGHTAGDTATIIPGATIKVNAGAIANAFASLTIRGVDGTATAGPTRIILEGDNLDLVGGAAIVPRLAVNHNLIIERTGTTIRTLTFSATASTINVARGVVADIRVPVESGGTGEIIKTGDGELIYNSATRPVAATTMTVSADSGTFTIHDRGLAGHIKLSNGSTLNFAPDATGTTTLNAGVWDEAVTIVGTGVDARATVNVLPGLELVTTAVTYFNTVFLGGAQFFDVNVRDGATLSLGATLSRISDGNFLAGANVRLNVEKGGKLNTDAVTTISGASIISGDIELRQGSGSALMFRRNTTVAGNIYGDGDISLSPLADAVYKFSGSNRYDGHTYINGTFAAATFEISNPRSAGHSIIVFMSQAFNATISIPADTAPFAFDNVIDLATIDGRIAVGDNSIVEHTGKLTSTGGRGVLLKVDADGELILNGTVDQTSLPVGVQVSRGILELRRPSASTNLAVTVATRGALRLGSNGQIHTGNFTWGAGAVLLANMTEANTTKTGVPFFNVLGKVNSGSTTNVLHIGLSYKGRIAAGTPLFALKSAAFSANVTEDTVRVYDSTDSTRLAFTTKLDRDTDGTRIIYVIADQDYVFPGINADAATGLTVSSPDLLGARVPVVGAGAGATATAAFVDATLAGHYALTATVGDIDSNGDGVAHITGAYPPAGTYQIRLNVASTAGLTDTALLTLIVRDDGSTSWKYTQKLNFVDASNRPTTSGTVASPYNLISGKIAIGQVGSQAINTAYTGALDATIVFTPTNGKPDEPVYANVVIENGVGEFTLKPSDILPGSPTQFSDGAYAITVKNSADFGTESATIKYTVSKGTPEPPRGSGGGGGCDAGFGSLSLLAAGAFVTLRRKG